MGVAMRVLKGIAAAAAFGGLLVASAAATTASAGDDGRWMVKIQALGVLPDTGGADVELPNGLGALGAPPGTVLDDGADVTDAWVPGADIGYFVTPNISLNLICCFAQHEVKSDGALAAAIGEETIGSTWIFPPAVTANYHFNDFGAIQPYIGAGVQWIHFFDEKPKGTLAALGVDDLTIDDAAGFVLQGGVDVALGGGWYANADVKKVFLNTDATFSAGGVTVAQSSVDLDPWIVGVGVGYRFNLEDLFGARGEPLK